MLEMAAPPHPVPRHLFALQSFSSLSSRFSAFSSVVITSSLIISQLILSFKDCVLNHNEYIRHYKPRSYKVPFYHSGTPADYDGPEPCSETGWQ